MNLTLTSLAFIASFSSAVTTPIAGITIQASQTQLLSKDEIVQIINVEQQTSINDENITLRSSSLILENAVFATSTTKATNQHSRLIKVKKAMSDDE